MVSIAGPETEDAAVVEFAPLPSKTAVAWRDLVEGFRRNWMWSALALQDIKLRYRGSVLGPFWLTITTLVTVFSMGFIYSHLFHTATISYMPYLGMGLIVWQLISSSITEGCNTFLASLELIQQVPVPFSIHAYRVVCRNFIVFGHNLVLVPVGVIVFQLPVDWHLLEAGAGCIVLAVNGLWVAIFLGIISTRFRDIAPIVASFLQVAFFLTPVFWPIDALGIYQPLAEYNPLFTAIDVIRAPVLGVPIMPHSWPVLLLSTAVGCAATCYLFVRYRNRIAYWI
jgi:ABC-type polysaccharide/polyol phosphate export permease